MTDFRIGIDLGGTKTEVILLNGSSQGLFRTRIPTVRDDYAATLRDIASLVAQAEAAAGQSNLPVGIGIPGTVSRKTGFVKNANSTWLNGNPFQKDLSVHLNRDVKITNDANCLAVSEATDGAGRGHDLVFAGILGTGCGAGVAYKGLPIVGPNGVAGEWGHNSLPWTREAELEARPCYCGKSGCQETFLSGTGLCKSYEILTGLKVTGSDIVARAAKDEIHARQVLDAYFDQLARDVELSDQVAVHGLTVRQVIDQYSVIAHIGFDANPVGRGRSSRGDCVRRVHLPGVSVCTQHLPQ